MQVHRLAAAAAAAAPDTSISPQACAADNRCPPAETFIDVSQDRLAGSDETERLVTGHVMAKEVLFSMAKAFSLCGS